MLLPIRYVMAIMGSIGLAILYGFKVNVSVAIVAMVNHTAVKLSTFHDSDANSSIVAEEVCGASNVTKTAVEVSDNIFIFYTIKLTSIFKKIKFLESSKIYKSKIIIQILHV